jgi:cytochrome P450
MDSLAEDPTIRYQAFDEMRKQCPVHAIPGLGHMAVSYPAVATGLRSITSFGGSAAQDGLPEEDTTVAGILEPRHMEIRRIINRVVSGHASQQIERYLEAFTDNLAAGLLRDVAASPDAVDIMGSFVEPIPPAAMAKLLGFPEEDSQRYYAWGAELGVRMAEAVSSGKSLAMRDAAPSMTTYVEDRISEREALPEDEWPNDALTRFLTTEVEGERLSTRAIVTQIMFAIGAGSDTTRNTLGSLFFRLAQAPDVYAELRRDRSLVEAAVEEALRIDSPAQFLVRRCLVEDFALEGTPLTQGEMVFMSIGSANRDPVQFSDPDTFDVRRPELRDHLAFGTGPHTCPGATLARTEMRIALNTWCDTVESFELADRFTWEPPGTGMLHGPTRLPLRIHPAAS